MNICKILSMNAGLEMSSWGTLHFPEEKRILEWLIQIENTQWKATNFDRCKRAPLKDEAASLRRMFKFCRTPAKTQVFRRFQVD